MFHAVLSRNIFDRRYTLTLTHLLTQRILQISDITALRMIQESRLKRNPDEFGIYSGKISEDDLSDYGLGGQS